MVTRIPPHRDCRFAFAIAKKVDLMHTIRSFVAIPLGVEVLRGVRKMARELRSEDDGMKWVPEDTLNLTIKFLGDVVDREVPRVCDVIRRCCESIEPFELTMEGAGGFPSADRPRVVWAGITQGGESLIELVTRLEKSLADLGFKPESRDYRPHLPLGRVRSGSRAASPEVVQRVLRLGSRKLGSFQVESVQLFASYLEKVGPSYSVMDTIYLGAKANESRDDEVDDDDDEVDDDDFDDDDE